MKLTGKIALVTGAGKGIGRAISQALAKEGATVIVSDIDKEIAEETAESIEKKGKSSLPLWMDVTSSNSIDKAIHEINKRYGKIDILVNNAGVSTMTKVVDMTEEEWDFNMDVNAKGVFLCSKAVAQEMIKKDVKGKIVNISSIAGKAQNIWHIIVLQSTQSLVLSRVLRLNWHHIILMLTQFVPDM